MSWSTGNEALRYYVDRRCNESRLDHYSGGPDELPQLEQLIVLERRSP